MPRAVLLDVDGTLIDSGYLHAVAWWQALRKQNLDVPMSTIHRAIGMGGDHLVPHILGDRLEEADVDGLRTAHAAIFSTYWPALRRLPGARELVRHCHEAGMKTILSSSAGGPELEVLRRVLDADEWLTDATASPDAENSKPAPDLVQAGLELAGVGPEDAVFVGDAVWDVVAASRAGVPCIGLECGGTSEAELRDTGAAEVYRDPRDLLDRWSGSMLAR